MVSARSFKAVKAQSAAATTPKMDLAWYAADKDGKVADNAQPLADGRTNASNVRLGVTITGFDGFPAGQFDRNGQYVGEDKDKVVFTVTVGILGVRKSSMATSTVQAMCRTATPTPLSRMMVRRSL